MSARVRRTALRSAKAWASRKCTTGAQSAAFPTARRQGIPLLTHENVHLLVQPVVHDEVVSHPHAVRLHIMTDQCRPPQNWRGNATMVAQRNRPNWSVIPYLHGVALSIMVIADLRVVEIRDSGPVCHRERTPLQELGRIAQPHAAGPGNQNSAPKKYAKPARRGECATCSHRLNVAIISEDRKPSSAWAAPPLKRSTTMRDSLEQHPVAAAGS